MTPRVFGRWVVATLLAVGVLVEMQRDTELHWSAADVAPSALLTQVPAIQRSCPVFVLDTTAYPEGTPPWKPAVDAVMVSMVAEVPTADGYSRAAPTGHPGFAAPPDALTAWMRTEGYGGKVCVVSPSEVRTVAD